MDAKTSWIENTKPFRVLSLDGGGAKAFYTLGVLQEIEAMTGKLLCESFDLIFGTSTGAIVASLAALGNPVDKIHDLYLTHVPSVMGVKQAPAKSAALEKLAADAYKNTSFMDVKTGIGILAARLTSEEPMIFTADANHAGRHDAAVATSFGISMADAVVASCSAYPFFMTKKVTTSSGEEIELLDGSYCATNPTLFAIADALQHNDRENLRVLSLGVGHYPEARCWDIARIRRALFRSKLLPRIRNLDTDTMDRQREILFPDVHTVRICRAYTQPKMTINMMDHDLTKLGTLHQRGRESFAEYERDIRQLLT